MQKNGVETLHGDRYALEKKKTFAFFAAGWTDVTAKGIEKVNGRAVKNACIFNSNLLEKIWLRQHLIFADFPYCCQLS